MHLQNTIPLLFKKNPTFFERINFLRYSTYKSIEKRYFKEKYFARYFKFLSKIRASFKILKNSTILVTNIFQTIYLRSLMYNIFQDIFRTPSSKNFIQILITQCKLLKSFYFTFTYIQENTFDISKLPIKYLVVYVLNNEERI